MKRIYKYTGTFVKDEKDFNHCYTELQMPIEAFIIKSKFVVDLDFPLLTIWAIVDPNCSPTSTRRFEIYGTGRDIENLEDLKHIDTVFNGPFVWHIFERILTKV